MLATVVKEAIVVVLILQRNDLALDKSVEVPEYWTRSEGKEKFMLTVRFFKILNMIYSKI